MILRARSILTIVSALTLAFLSLRHAASGATKPDDDDTDKKKTEAKKSSGEKKKTKSSDSKKEPEKPKPKPKPEEKADEKPKAPDKDSPKDVTDQKAGRTKAGDSSKDSKTMDGSSDGEFEKASGDNSKSPEKPAKESAAKSATTSSSMPGWDLVHTQDRDYVTAGSINRFYRFHEMKTDGNSVQFISPVLVMKGSVGSADLLINNIKFVMSYPMLESGGKVLISRLDLCKLIDPVLRPSYIGSASSFDTVIIDAGHGGHDSGAAGVYGYEKDFALKLAFQLKADLEKRGLKVRMTRSDDTFISLAGRVAIANKIPNSIFVALHFNSGGTSATGIETYALSPQGSSSIYGARSVDSSAYNGNQRDSENIALATAIHAAVVHRFKMVDRGVKRARWYVLTGLERPGVLFEGGFVTNPNDGRFIAAGNFRTELAQTIGDAIINYRRALKPASVR